MEYKLTKRFDSSFYEESLALWEFASKKTWGTIKLFGFCVLFNAGLALLDYVAGKPISLFVSSMGTACLILFGIFLFSYFQSKANNKKKVIARLNEFGNNPTAVNELLFTENFVRFSDPEMQIEIQWPRLAYFKESAKYLYIYMKDSETPVFSLDKTRIPESMEKGLFDLIASKITARR